MRAWAVSGYGRLPDEFRPAMQAALGDMWGDAIRSSGKLVEDEFKSFDHMESKDRHDEFYQNLIRFFFEAYGRQRQEQIVDTTSDQIIRLVARGQLRGLSRAEIEKSLLESIENISRARANVIVRTETHSASQFASMEVAKTSRIDLDKVWNSTEDPRTRDFGEGDGVMDQFNHRMMDEARVPMDQPFMVWQKNLTKEALMFPGDPMGSAGNIVNCRCVMTYKRALSA